MNMSYIGNCYDNAPMESFWITLKQEYVCRSKFSTRARAQQEAFEYIEVLYHRFQRHSSLEYCTPFSYEERVM